MTVYLNNAATSYPGPPSVRQAVIDAMDAPPVEPGRTSVGVDPLDRCRRKVAQFVQLCSPERVVITPSATFAINLVINSVPNGAHVVTTDAEHNAVLRALAHAAVNRGVEVTHVVCDHRGFVAPGQIEEAIRTDTRLVAISHASNVTGVVQPIQRVAEITADRGIPFLVDAAQSAGTIPLDLSNWSGQIFVALAGHKGLYGPMGTGALLLPDLEIPQLIVGGTGVQSESEMHPGTLPLRHEAGTPNLSGAAGLAAGVDWVLDQQVEQLGQHRAALAKLLRQGLCELGDRVSVIPRTEDLTPLDLRCGVVSLVAEAMKPAEIGFALNEAFGISVRTGLHCAPRIHAALGTAPLGTVRVSVGAFNCSDDIERLVHALAELIP